MRLDHVSYATTCDRLPGVVQRIGSALGAGFVDGGVHPRFGTRNFVLPIGGHAYVEVVAALDHPAADRMPFGQAVKQRAALGGGWLGWVVSVDDLTPVEVRLGRSAVEGNRRLPDGSELLWRQIGVNDLMADPQLPFFIQWISPDSQHPSNGGRSWVSIERMDIAGDPTVVADWLGAPVEHPLDDVDVEWLDDDPGLVAVHFRTPDGTVRID